MTTQNYAFFSDVEVLIGGHWMSVDGTSTVSRIPPSEGVFATALMTVMSYLAAFPREDITSADNSLFDGLVDEPLNLEQHWQQDHEGDLDAEIQPLSTAEDAERWLRENLGNPRVQQEKEVAVVAPQRRVAAEPAAHPRSPSPQADFDAGVIVAMDFSSESEASDNDSGSSYSPGDSSASESDDSEESSVVELEEVAPAVEEAVGNEEDIANAAVVEAPVVEAAAVEPPVATVDVLPSNRPTRCWDSKY